MLQYKWTNTTIRTNKQANDMIALFEKLQPRIGGFDTESDGLNVVLNKPFLVQFGFLHPTELLGYTYAVDLELTPILAKQVIAYWHKLAKRLGIYLAHNTKFDLHMLTNVGHLYREPNVSDTMFYIRYGTDAVQQKYGGAPLGLKEFATQYVDGNAKHHERLLKQEQAAIAQAINMSLRLRLKNAGTPPEKYKAKTYTNKVIEQIFKDKVLDVQDLPEEIREPYLEWLATDVPVWAQGKVVGLLEAEDVPYNILNRENLTRYAHYDIVYLLESYMKLAPVIEARGNLKGVEIENQLIYPFLEMERTGFQIDKQYLRESKERVRKYILRRRMDMLNMTGIEFSVGQHQVIKEILNTQYHLNVASTGSEELDILTSDLIREGGHEEAVAFIAVVQELRTLEKWYSTYICRFEYNLRKHDRLYPTINQVQPVSGRVSSDFQQFPKDAITDIDGNELFQPRKLVITSRKEDYDAIVYLDYSQIELRFQAFYTILCGHPDLNLCRAYMPYDCVDENGNHFDYTNYNDICRWNEKWWLNENRHQQWKPTDVHGATTKAAFDITEEDPDYHHLRYVGKRVNFAKNYGAQLAKIKTMFPQYDDERCKKIDGAYYKAFPGVKVYHQYCYARAQFAYTENLFGIKYYGVSGHKLINMLIQGSSAFFLKLKIIEIYNWMKKKNLKSRLQMQIHDELSWEYHKDDDPAIFFELQKIMQDWDEAYVPIVADMEVTTTNWAEKKEVRTLEEFQICLID